MTKGDYIKTTSRNPCAIYSCLNASFGLRAEVNEIRTAYEDRI